MRKGFTLQLKSTNKSPMWVKHGREGMEEWTIAQVRDTTLAKYHRYDYEDESYYKSLRNPENYVLYDRLSDSGNFYTKKCVTFEECMEYAAYLEFDDKYKRVDE